jgi:hypothetical protein
MSVSALKAVKMHKNEAFSTGRFYAPSQAIMRCKAYINCRKAFIK